MRFKEWLLNEVGSKALIEVDPSITPQPKIVGPDGPVEMISPDNLAQVCLKALKKFSTKHDPKGWNNIKERYAFKLTKANYKDGRLRVSINIKMRTSDATPVFFKPEDPELEFPNLYPGGYTGKVSHRTPKDALEDIPVDPNLAYRGMSWEEWQSIQKTGKIQSKGIYNIEQEGLTFFGVDPSTALSYATHFAPMQYVASSKRPGVVIAVDKKHLISDHPQIIQDTEMALKGSLPKEEIKQVYIIKPEQSSEKRNSQDFIFPYKAMWHWKDTESPNKHFYILDENNPEEGGGSTNPLISYFIKRIK